MTDVTAAANELHDLQTWVAVFEEEYDLPAEVVTELRQRIERIAEALETLA